MLARDLSHAILKAASSYPVVTVTGPRQSGKTTLLKHLFSNKPYVSLEELDERAAAKADPRGFLKRFPNGALLDEAQHAPELFSYIQTRVDDNQKPGEFILSGSQNFLLLETISQSLAGRSAIIFLLPLSGAELAHANFNFLDPFDLIFKGFYPRLYLNNHLDSSDWYKNYMLTYLERDVRAIKKIQDLSKFQLFLRLCVGRIGQLINFSTLSSESGLDIHTVKSWLGILEASFILFLLKPHHQNFNKRLVKQPKLYFYDTGLACHLLGLQNAEQLHTHYNRGNLFENFIIAELMKTSFNQDKTPCIFFWRDHRGQEIDVLIEQGQKLVPIEIKSSQTFNAGFMNSLDRWCGLSGCSGGYLIYGGDQSYVFKNHQLLSWKSAGSILLP